MRRTAIAWAACGTRSDACRSTSCVRRRCVRATRCSTSDADASRGGVHFVRFLEPGRYYGIDKDAELIRAGLEIELPRAGLAGRLAPTTSP